MTLYNETKNKLFSNLNGAGDSKDNPILKGLPLKFYIFNSNIDTIRFFLSNSIGTTKELTVNSDNSLYFVEGVAGDSNFSFLDQFTDITIVMKSKNNEKETRIYKKIYIANIPSDSIKVFDSVLQTFTNHNVSSLVSQMCGVLFFDSFFDEFKNKTFGGCAFVSVFDRDTDENSNNFQYVITQKEIPIRQLNNIQLAKHFIATQENHFLDFLFKSSRGGQGFKIQVNLRTVACWGFTLKTPLVKHRFPQEENIFG